MNDAQSAVQDLVDAVRTSDASAFYRDMWGGAETFSDIPAVSRAEFIATPLSRRRYKDESGLVKVVRYPEGVFLSEWSFDDIQKEQWGEQARRPMVYLSNSYEAVEKSMWCRENNMIPLIGEKMAEASVFTASKYRIDALITDSRSLEKMLPFFTASTEPISSITVIGDSFNYEQLAPYSRFARRIRLLLILPETGAFADAPYSSAPVFSPLGDSLVEHQDGVLVLTKRRLLTTPIIQYRTDIATHPVGDPSGGFTLVNR
ncbi:hypothetical protein K8R03_02775 [Candidatus Kaiserbacteria bacterium]|nr:hypothetical protein [Candidatus Kaiserbacteria bacterium]